MQPGKTAIVGRDACRSLSGPTNPPTSQSTRNEHAMNTQSTRHEHTKSKRNQHTINTQSTPVNPGQVGCGMGGRVGGWAGGMGGWLRCGMGGLQKLKTWVDLILTRRVHLRRGLIKFLFQVKESLSMERDKG